MLLDFRGVASGSAPAVTNVKNEDIDKVRVATNSHDPLITRVVIDLARKLPFTVEQVGDDLRVMFSRAVASVAMRRAQRGNECPRARHARRTTGRETRSSSRTTLDPSPVALLPRLRLRSSRPRAHCCPGGCRSCCTRDLHPSHRSPPCTADGDRPGAHQPDAAAGADAGQSRRRRRCKRRTRCSKIQNPNGQRQFSGDPVTLDFQGADLRAVLRTFAEISNGLNIVIDPSIQGTVDVSLHDVPWDQALDIILRANKLGYTVDGNIVRIVPLTCSRRTGRAPQTDRSAGARRRAAHRTCRSAMRRPRTSCR